MRVPSLPFLHQFAYGKAKPVMIPVFYLERGFIGRIALCS